MSQVVQGNYGTYNVSWTIKSFNEALDECNPANTDTDGDGLPDPFDPDAN